MLTKKLASLGLTMAMTASLSLLAGCPAPTTSTPEGSASASVAPSASADASVAPSASASATASVAPSASATASVAPSASATASASTAPASSTTPNNTTGDTTDIKEKATFNGTVYDTTGVPVEGAKVTAKSIDPAVTWTGEDQVTAGGAYVFRNAPVGVRVLITVSKDGWTTRTRTEVLKSNLTGDPAANKFDFENRDAIQDEPEITSLKINDKAVTGYGTLDSSLEGHMPNKTSAANLTAVDGSNLKFEFGFSEPVDKEDFENAFNVYSKSFTREDYNNGDEFTTNFDSGLNEMSFDWSSDRKSVTVKTNKPVLAEKSGDEARYNLYLNNNALTDDTGKNALAYAGTDSYSGVIRFASKNAADNVVFSVKNDTDGPMLLGVTAKSGGGANDTIELRFSEPLEVVNHTSATAGLKINGYGFGSYSTTSGAALLLNSNDGDDDVIALAQVYDNGSSFEYVSNFSSDDLVKAKVEGNKVLLELDKDAMGTGVGALETGNKLVVSVGRLPKVPGLSFSGGSFVQLKDPAGNDIEAGNTSTSARIEVSGVQRVTTIN